MWLGVEDMTATLAKKAQDKDKTELAFRLLRENNILPMPTTMHHDSQPLVTWKSNYGLLNQIRLLRKAGSITTQVMMLMLAPGSKWYVNVFDSGTAFSKAGYVTVDRTSWTATMSSRRTMPAPGSSRSICWSPTPISSIPFGCSAR